MQPTLRLVQSTWQHQSPPFPMRYQGWACKLATYHHQRDLASKLFYVNGLRDQHGRPQCWNTRSNKSQVRVAFVAAAAPGLWHTCGSLWKPTRFIVTLGGTIAALFSTQSSPSQVTKLVSLPTPNNIKGLAWSVLGRVKDEPFTLCPQSLHSLTKQLI